MIVELVGVLLYAALLAAIGVTAWSLSQGALGRTVLGGLGTALALLAVLHLANAPTPPREPSQGPVAGCAYASFPICDPFQVTWEQNESFYGPALGTAILWQGRLTQCFVRACLQSWPELPPEYRVQGVLVGDEYYRVVVGEPSPSGSMALPPVVTRWLADHFRRGANLLDLLGEPVGHTFYDANLGRMVAIWQRAGVSWPEGSGDVADVRLEPLGEWYWPRLKALPAPWWGAAWIRVVLVLASTGASVVAVIRGLLDSGQGLAL